MADSFTTDLISHSITEGDIFPYQGNGVVNLIMPWAGTMSSAGLPTTLPPYFHTSTWTYNRDVILRATIMHEPYWANAVAIAGAKESAKSFDITGDVPRRVADAHELMVQWGGNGYVRSQKMGVMDYLTTNNGEFWEIVRQSSAAGSKILGLVHLDSLRCRRTGDPDIPVIYYDLRGRPHDLKFYQVIELVDMPDPSYPVEGIGHCAAERVYPVIYKISAMVTADNERIVGSGAHQLALLYGMSPAQLNGLLATARAEAQAKGLINYLGTVIAALQGDMVGDIKTLQLRGLPDNYNYKEQIDLAHLAYANSIGLVLTDLQPLSGQGLGTGAQTIVIEEKASGRSLSTRDKELTHLLNEWIMPDATTFAFAEKDLRTEQSAANVALAREQVRNSMILNGTITAAQARNMAADVDDIPEEFAVEDVTAEESVSDEDRTDEALEQPQATPTSAPPAEMSTADQRIMDRDKPEPIGSAAQMPKAKERVMLIEIKEQLKQLREVLTA